MAGALEGGRVIEFANYVSGPYAGMLLGDMGAEIIKVEEPSKADPQVQHRKMRVDVPHPTVGTVGYVRNGVRLSETSNSVRFCSPEPWEHNDEILSPLRRHGG